MKTKGVWRVWRSLIAVVGILLILPDAGAIGIANFRSLQALNYIVDSPLLVNTAQGELFDAASRNHPVSDCNAEGAPLTCLAQGLASLEEGRAEAAITALTSAVNQRPGDVVMNYFLARAHELEGDFLKATELYERLSWYQDSSTRLVDLYYLVLKESPELTRERQIELLKQMEKIAADDLWLLVMLTNLGNKTPEETGAALSRLRFEQVTASTPVQVERIEEAVRLAHSKGLLPSEFLPRILAYWAIDRQLTPRHLDSVDEVSSRQLRGIEMQMDHESIQQRQERSANECAQWTITDRTSQEVTSLPRRYNDAEFTSATIVWKGDEACWLQGLWNEPTKQYLPASLVATRHFSVESDEFVRVSLRYRTFLFDSGDSHISIYLEGSDEDSESTRLVSGELAAVGDDTGQCVVELKRGQTRTNMSLSVRLWYPAVIVLEDFAVVTSDDTLALFPKNDCIIQQ